MKTVIVLILVLFSGASAQIDSTLREYFPMHIGDVWEYVIDLYPDYPRVHVQVIGDTLVPNGNVYFQFEIVGEDSPRIDLFRMDDSLRVYKYLSESSNCTDSEFVMYDLRLLDESIWPTCIYNNQLCSPAYIGLVFTQKGRYYPRLNLLTDTKMFCEAQVDTINKDTSFCPLVPCITYLPQRVARGLGLVWTQFEGPAKDLDGAIINGIRYGTILAVQGEHNLPSAGSNELKLLNSYPNPFNSESRIKYYVGVSQKLELYIYDVFGRKIKTLVSERKNPGEFEVVWHGNDDLGNQVASGVYYTLLRSELQIATGKLILLK